MPRAVAVFADGRADRDELDRRRGPWFRLLDLHGRGLSNRIHRQYVVADRQREHADEDGSQLLAGLRAALGDLLQVSLTTAGRKLPDS